MMRFRQDDRSQTLMFAEQDSTSAVNKHIEESLSSLACLQASYEIKLQENKQLHNRLSIAISELELRDRQITAMRFALEQRKKLSES